MRKRKKPKTQQRIYILQEAWLFICYPMGAGHMAPGPQDNAPPSQEFQNKRDKSMKKTKNMSYSQNTIKMPTEYKTWVSCFHLLACIKTAKTFLKLQTRKSNLEQN